MELWRDENLGDCPNVFTWRNFLQALGAHLVVFACFWTYSALHDLFKKEEEIIPIDLSVIVNENLDGKEDEPPPIRTVKPPPPDKKVKKSDPVVKKPDPPKPLEQIQTNVVTKATKKPAPPKPPEKTAAERQKERLERIRDKLNKAKTVKINVDKGPTGDGRTDPKTLSDKDVLKLLGAGVKPGKSEQLAKNELQFGYSLIKSAFEEKWDKPPWTDTLRPMTIRVWFGGGGTIVRYQLEKSSGDRRADQSIISAASRVGSIPALPASFVENFRSKGVPVQFTVTPQ